MMLFKDEIRQGAFFALVVVFMFAIYAGCRPQETETDMGKDGQAEDISCYCSYGVFDGHEYVVFKTTGGTAGRGGITHSPNCPCHTNELTLVVK